MRKWLRITIFVGLGGLLVVAAGLLVTWKALQHVPEFYREALAVTPPPEEEAGDGKSPQATAPASDRQQEDHWNALFARAAALASDRDASEFAPAPEEEASDEKSPQATALTNDRDAPAVTPAPEEEANDKKGPQATALASDRDAPAVTPAPEEEASDEKSPQAAAPAGDREQEGPWNAMFARAKALASDRGQEDRWNGLFTAEEINGWLAVDLGKNLANLMRGSLSDPRVAIEQDTLMVGCRLRRGDATTVLSLSGDAYLAGPNTVGVRIRTARAGAVPLPVGKIESYISEAANRSGLTVQWRQFGRLPVALISFPAPRSEADRLVRIDTLRCGKGEIYLSGSTQQP